MVYGRASPIWDAILNRRVSNDSVSLTEIPKIDSHLLHPYSVRVDRKKSSGAPWTS